MMDEEKYNFVKMYERSFRENWELPAVTDYGTDVTLTYGQLAINIEKLHILFAACGIKKNDKMYLIFYRVLLLIATGSPLRLKPVDFAMDILLKLILLVIEAVI